MLLTCCCTIPVMIRRVPACTTSLCRKKLQQKKYNFQKSITLFVMLYDVSTADLCYDCYATKSILAAPRALKPVSNAVKLNSSAAIAYNKYDKSCIFVSFPYHSIRTAVR